MKGCERMITSQQWADMVYSGLEMGIKELWNAIYPVMAPIVIASIVFNLIIDLLKRKVNQDCIVNGYSVRQAKKKAKEFDKFIEGISNVNEIVNIEKD